MSFDPTREPKLPNYAARLAGIPTWALEAEMGRRGEAPEADLAIRLPGVTIDPVANLLAWRGEEYLVGGRMMEVLYGIARMQQRGFRRVNSKRLAHEIWRGWDEPDALQCLRTYIGYILRRFPGLIVREVADGRTRAYSFALEAPAREAVA